MNSSARKCDVLLSPAYPPPPVLPAGLETLKERQWIGFTRYRKALLSSVGQFPQLEGWRPSPHHDAHRDVGELLLDMWSYVLDVTGFYDARTAEQSYLRTAPDIATAHRIAALIGYQPRPAMSASVKLALQAEGDDPINIPPGSAVRSDPFDDEPPQVFEFNTPFTVWPARNRWRLAPIPHELFDGTATFARGCPHRAATVVFNTTGEDRSPTPAAAARVVEVKTVAGPDEASYQMPVFDTAGQAGIQTLVGHPTAEIEIAILRMTAELSSLGPNNYTANSGLKQTTIILDTLYSQLRPGQPAALEINGMLHPVHVVEAVGVPIPTTPTDGVTVNVLATLVTLSPAITKEPNAAVVLHMAPVQLPPMQRPAKTRVGLDDISTSADLAGANKLLDDAPDSGDALILGARNHGAEFAGRTTISDDGSGSYFPNSDIAEFTQDLVTPVSIYGNVVDATRGETVSWEILGSGAGGISFQAFTLKKAPLSFLADPATALGRRPELSVFVDGFEWQLVDSFYGVGPTARVYTLMVNEKGEATVQFGNGLRGTIPASGSKNIACTYRFGAGGAVPPAGSIKTAKKSIKGIVSLNNPLSAFGGADAENIQDIRTNAARSVMTLGRAVSAADFEAFASNTDGIVNAAAGWTWDQLLQRASIHVWIIAQAGDPSPTLKDYLATICAPGLPITVQLAVPQIHPVTINIALEEGYSSDIVMPKARSALLDDRTGILAAGQIVIGGPIYRSRIVEALHAVTGIDHVASVHFSGEAMDFAVSPGEGKWFDFTDTLSMQVIT